MPVTFKNNIGTVLGICNGTVGRITNIVLDPRERPLINFANLSPHYLHFPPLAVHVDISKPGTTKERIVFFIMNCVNNQGTLLSSFKSWDFHPTLSQFLQNIPNI